MITWEYLVLWILVYILFAVIVQRKDVLPDGFSHWGPILTIRSQKGLATIEKLAALYPWFWRPWGTIGVISAVVTAVIGVVFLGISIIGLLTQPEQVELGPSDMVVIPGVNQFLPLEAAPEIILGLLIGMVVHEAGHAILCRVGDIDVESTGVIFGALIPLGAFVEPDEDSIEDSTLPAQLRMFAAGIVNNFAVFILTVAGLYLIVSVAIVPATGVGVAAVFDDSPAERMGIEEGDSITAVDGVDIDNEEEFNEKIGGGAETITINENNTIELESGAFIMQSPDGIGLEPGDTVIAVENESVTSPEEFESMLLETEDTHVEVTLDDNSTADLPVGALVTGQQSSGLAEQIDLDQQESNYIFEIDGERVYDESTFDAAVENASGESVEVVYMSPTGDVKTATVDVAEDDDSLYVHETVSGLQASLIGVQTYPAETYYNFLTPPDSISELAQNLFALLLLPIGSLTPGIEFNFPGFTPFIQNFYTVEGVPSPFEPAIFFSAGVLFWTAWINFNLALFNCLPTFALDGGHILRALTEMTLGDYVGEDALFWSVIAIKSAVLLLLLGLILGPLLI